MHFNVERNKIMSDKFYQHDYIILTVQFLKLILFLG